MAAALKNEGVKEGDVVAAFAGNVPEVVVFMLAAASIGAIFTTVPPDFGIAAVKDRLCQTKPVVLLASKAVYYNGKVYDQYPKIIQLTDQVESIKKVIILSPSFEPSDEKFIDYTQFIRPFQSVELIFAQLPFNHPMYILYSSGTTGKPKCLVHSAGGTLIQHLKEHHLHGDLTRDDIVLQYTNIGWMMWHWLVSVLAVGSTIVLYEGSPFKPTNDQLWKLIEKHKITRFGTSAKYIQHLHETDTKTDGFDISSLRTIYSTGSPLSPCDFRFIYEKIKKDVQVSSITGGTDIISLFGAGNPLLPVYAGEIQCSALGMAVKAFTEDGETVYDVPGDLVCIKPFPSMPVYFWNDPSGELYRAAYFSRFPHTWHHGDFVQFSSRTGGLMMLGRSDSTLNPAGVRFGSAELYNVLTRFPQVQDSLVVGVRRREENDERVVMFLKTSTPITEELVGQIKVQIRSLLSPRHVPALILPTMEIPYTLNGKKVEVAVKRILSGNIDITVSSLSNPESLDFYRSLARDPTFLP